MTIALLLAGGSGARLKTETPKQFIRVCGKTIIEHTLDVFEQHAQIDEIIVVIHAQFVEVMEKIVQSAGYKKIKRILKGGTERQESSWVGIKACREYPEANLIIHDAVRPLIDAETITKVVTVLEKYHAVTIAIPTSDTIYTVERERIKGVPDRKQLMRAQTPQGFKQHIIQKAYQYAFQDKNFLATDDCSVVAKYLPTEPIVVVKGKEQNVKITHMEDLYFLEKILQTQR